MTRSIREERLMQAMMAAAERVKVARQRAAGRSGPAAPGDVYALRGLGLDDLGWLVVRSHAEQPNQLFAVPVDDNPQWGTPDVPLPGEQVARCGEGAWVSAELLPDQQRVDVVPEELLHQVRAGVAALAAGEFNGDPERRAADDDPNYQRWMRRVGRAREKLEQRADSPGQVLSFLAFREAPPEYAAQTPLALAAKTGGLTEEMEAAGREADRQVRYHRLSGIEQGLLLAANEYGLMLTWEGREDDRPAVRVRGADGKTRKLTWRPGEGERPLFVTELLRWNNGGLVLRVGKEKVTIRR
jgi:hypothetical protein